MHWWFYSGIAKKIGFSEINQNIGQIDHEESKNHAIETQEIVFNAHLGFIIEKLVRCVKISKFLEPYLGIEYSISWWFHHDFKNSDGIFIFYLDSKSTVMVITILDIRF